MPDTLAPTPLGDALAARPDRDHPCRPLLARRPATTDAALVEELCRRARTAAASASTVDRPVELTQRAVGDWFAERGGVAPP